MWRSMPMFNRPKRLMLGLALVVSCGPGRIDDGKQNGGPIGGMTDPRGGPGVTPPPPYEPISARAYASKVKDLLTGLPLSDEELQLVSADERALRGLIDRWMDQPAFRDKMIEFFKKAFQQTQLTAADLDEQLRLASGGVSNADQRLMVRSVEESFARTALALISEGRPFTETVTTTRFMLNVPMMVGLAYMDAAPQNDVGRPVQAGYWHLAKFGGANNFKFVQTTNTNPATGLPTPIPFEETINPASPNFMKWNFTQPDPLQYKACPDPITVTGANAINAVFRALFGGRQGCQGAPSERSLFGVADWNTWRMVTIRQPRPGEERTTFWDLNKLRDPGTTELVVAAPRVGFLTTLGFFANWPTNTSNQYRVTINQALIVALGKSFDDRATVAQVAETGVDAQHVDPSSPCYGCHQVLDPMRDFYKQSYSLTYFEQLSALDPKNPALPAEGVFNVGNGAPVRGRGVETLARAMADSPLFAPAWTQKLCQLANASPCDESDAEFVRVADAFRASQYDFRTLLRELLSSPLVTYTARTKTAETQGVVLSIARRDNFCDRLGNRLGYKDLCNQLGESTLPRVAGQVRNLSLGIPGSSYARADERPVTPHDPNVFFVSATEKICMAVAGQLVDATATARWKITAREAAYADFASLVMGVPPSDPMTPGLIAILANHNNAAIAAKEAPLEALRSTFTLACSSPLAVSSGL